MTPSFQAPPVLQTERLTLGPASLAHFEAFAAFVATEHSRFIGGPGGRDDAWDSMAKHAGQWTLRGYGTFWLTETATGVPVGRVGLWHPSWLAQPELTWLTYEPFARRGYAVEAAARVRDWAAGLGLRPLQSLIDPENRASQAVARRLGAREEGVHVGREGQKAAVWRHPPGRAA